MKILVLSDTHSYLDNARNVLKRIGDKMDMVFHLGDHDADVLELQKEFPKLPFHYVKGNNDYLIDTPSKKMVRVGGKNLLLTHGHKQRVHWNPDTISYWAAEQGA
ncbi:MAG: metallophosphoesterase family protein, partial [Anaerotignum sp.]|nr:metallophosphoesterase family protein [Anaerotignum sp.]